MLKSGFLGSASTIEMEENNRNPIDVSTPNTDYIPDTSSVSNASGTTTITEDSSLTPAELVAKVLSAPPGALITPSALNVVHRALDMPEVANTGNVALTLTAADKAELNEAAKMKSFLLAMGTAAPTEHLQLQGSSILNSKVLMLMAGAGLAYGVWKLYKRKKAKK